MVALAAAAAPSQDSFARVAMRQRYRPLLPLPALAHPARAAVWTGRQLGHLGSQDAALPGYRASDGQKYRRQQRLRSQRSVSATMKHCRWHRPAPGAPAPPSAAVTLRTTTRSSTLRPRPRYSMPAPASLAWLQWSASFMATR